MIAIEEAKYKEFLEQTGDEFKAKELWLRWKALTDLYFLATDILGWKEVRRGTDNRLDPRFHKWLCRILSIEDDKLILVPRLHLKTAFVKCRIIQQILKNPYKRILLASKTSGLVERELRDIKRLLCTPLLRRLFPDVIPEPGKDFLNWQKSTANELTMIRPEVPGAYIPQEPQVMVIGAGGTLVGSHFDDAYIDDPLDEDTVRTIGQEEKLEEWWTYLQPILGDALITVTGTPYHYSDLFNKIIQRREFGKNVFIRSVRENGQFIYSYLNEKRFAKWTKGMSSYAVSCQFYCKAVPEEDKMFPEPQPVFERLPEGRYRYYIAVDPAATDNPWSDDTGLVVGAVDDKNHLWIVEASGIKKDPNGVADFIINKYLQYRPQRIGIELGLQNALQYLVQVKKQVWEQAHNQKLGLNIWPITVSRTKKKSQRITMTFGAFVREGRCHISTNCIGLLDQMRFYTGQERDKDDLIDAASMLFSTIESFAQYYWYKPQFKNTPFTFFDLFRVMGGKKKWEDKFVKG